VSTVTAGTEQDDAALVRAAAGGSEQAFKELVRRHEAPLYRFVWRQLRNHAEAADLCQEIFVKVFLKAGSFRGESSFRTWLFQIALNQCRNRFRSRGRERLEDVEIETLPLADCPASDAAEVAQEARRVRAAVESLPPRQRDTLELRFYQDCTFAEIAEIMSCPVGTAKANYHHAITSLRKRMRPDA
jgi:RNA polymerase sigma-70 factor, ECF subfamily